MQAKVSELARLRKEISDTEEQVKAHLEPLKQKRDQLQDEILAELKSQGVLSQRFQDATVTLSVRKTVRVVNEREAVEAFKAKGLTDYVSESVNKLFFDSLAKEIAKQGKTDIPGLAIKETEYLSVKSADKEERRKVVTE